MSSYAKMLILGALCAMAGCAVTPTRQELAVKDADAAMVSDCTFVGHVTGTSGWSGAASGAGQANAMNEARAKAASLGATNVVWSTVHSGWGSEAGGDAYRCNRIAAR